MSKIKVGDNVLVRETGEEGVVKGRDITVNDDGTFKIEFIVKKDNGFANWQSYDRKELKRNNKRKPLKPKKLPIYATRTTEDGYKIVVIGLLQESNTDYYYDLGICYFGYYALSIGYAICNPNDDFDLKTGIAIAKHRAKKTPFAKYVAGWRKDFTKETIDAIVNVKANYIAAHIEDFINQRDVYENYF